MTATLLDGKALAATIQRSSPAKWPRSSANRHRPCLAAVLVGDDPASEVYVRNKQLACARVGIESQLHRLAGQHDDRRTARARVGSIETPPAIRRCMASWCKRRCRRQVDRAASSRPSAREGCRCLSPGKCRADRAGRPRFLPCTPHGIQQLLRAQSNSTPAGMRSSSAAATSSASRWR